MVQLLEASSIKSPETSIVGLSHRIPGDIVNRATANLPENQRNTIRRMHGYYVENSLSLNHLAKEIEISPAALGLIFKGSYEASLDSMVKKFDRFFKQLDKPINGRKLKFIPIALSEKIWGICDQAREFQKVAFLFGDSQVGKSEALIQFREQSDYPDDIVYCAVPTGGTLSNFLMALAGVLRIPASLSTTRLRERIKEAFDERMILIVDEAHNGIRENSTSSRAVACIEFVREIYNAKQCGVVFCATNIFRDAMTTGPLEKILRQIKRRSLCTVQLPKEPSRTDLNTFAAAYKLKPAANEARVLEKEMIETQGLGMWLTLLRMGDQLAGVRKQEMTWSHVIAARAAQQSLEQPA
jgi:DNA transposition AAA+ family ATPase